MERKIYKVKMSVDWTDRIKNDGVIHKAGEILETEELARVNSILSRGIGVLDDVCIVTETSKDDSEQAILFEEQSYPLDVVKTALVNIGTKLSGNIGVAGVEKRVDALTEEQLGAFRAELEKNGRDDAD